MAEASAEAEDEVTDTYRVTGTMPVFGHLPGEEFVLERKLTDAEELLIGRSLARVTGRKKKG